MDHAFLSLIASAGAVITEAGTDPSVVGLVCIAAHMPDAGENEADDGKRFPVTSAVGAIKKTPQTGSPTSPPRTFTSTRSRRFCRASRFMAARKFSPGLAISIAVITNRRMRSKPSWNAGSVERTEPSTPTSNAGTPHEPKSHGRSFRCQPRGLASRPKEVEL